MIYVVLAPFLALVDLIAKYGIENMKEKDLPRYLGPVEIKRVYNRGFFMESFQNQKKLVKYLPLGITSFLVGVLALLLPQKGKHLQKLSLSLVIAGGLSNLFERLFKGYVVDYIHVRVKVLEKTVFNLGDGCIFLGGLLYLVSLLGSRKKKDSLQGRE